jgi:hypothetical protein
VLPYANTPFGLVPFATAVSDPFVTPAEAKAALLYE